MQLVLSNNRIIAHGEGFIAIGGVVINTETGAKHENATIAECSDCPSDIGVVGYEYHAGRFVPCAPFGKGTGNVAVYCDECKTPRDSGKSVDDFFGMSTYLTFVASQDSNTLDAAFGKNNEDVIRGVGAGLAMYGWFNGLDKTVYPFAHLRKMSTLNDMSLAVYNEIVSDDNFHLHNIVKASPYANDKIFDSYDVSGDTRTTGDDYDVTTQITITEANLLAPFVLTCSFTGETGNNKGTIYFNGVEAASYRASEDGGAKSTTALKNWSDYNITEPGTYDVRLALDYVSTSNDVTGDFSIRCAKEY